MYPLVGYKIIAWNAKRRKPISPSHNEFVWRERFMLAQCQLPHTPPADNCTCGVYAANNWETAKDYLKSIYSIVALAITCGRTIVWTGGYRTRALEIIGIVMPNNPKYAPAAVAAQVYFNVPMRTFGLAHEMIKVSWNSHSELRGYNLEFDKTIPTF